MRLHYNLNVFFFSFFPPSFHSCLSRTTRVLELVEPHPGMSLNVMFNKVQDLIYSSIMIRNTNQDISPRHDVRMFLQRSTRENIHIISITLSVF